MLGDPGTQEPAADLEYAQNLVVLTILTNYNNRVRIASHMNSGEKHTLYLAVGGYRQIRRLFRCSTRILVEGHLS